MAGLSDRELSDLAQSIEYKDGFTLRCDGRLLRWEYFVSDSYGKSDAITIIWQWFYVASDIDEEAVLRLIFAYLAYAEDHEMREQFKLRGRRVYNPHRKGAHICIKHLLPDDPLYHDVSITYDGDDLRWPDSC